MRDIIRHDTFVIDIDAVFVKPQKLNAIFEVQVFKKF